MLTFLSSFGQTFFISIFAKEIMSDFQLSEGNWGLIYGIGTTLSAVVMIRAGSLSDQFRTRQLSVIVLAGLSAACLAMAFNPWSSALVVIVLMLRLFGQGMASHLAVVAMSRWFVATRGRALAICTLGFTVGEFFFPITFVSLLTALDWRVLWMLSAGVALCGIPVLLALLRRERHPQQVAEETQAVGMRDEHWQRRTVLKHPLFWLLVPALLGPSAFNTAFFFHHVHFAELKGWSHLELVLLFPIYTSLGIVAMVLSGWAIDKWGSARTMPLYQLPMVVAFVCFAVGETSMALVSGFFFLAMTSGANSTIPNAFWAEFYGTRHIGSIKAMAAAVMVLGSAIGPATTGLLIDSGIRLDDQYLGVAAYFLLTTAFMWFGIRRYRQSAPSYRDRLR